MKKNLLINTEDQIKKKSQFEVYVSPIDSKLNVYALIDYGKKNRDNIKATVFDFREIYREVLEFTKN